MKFSEIVGQQNLKETLMRMTDQGRVSHAQLFVGDEGRGALALAIAFAQYINCKSPANGDSCGVCSSCIQMQQLAHPDVHYIFPVNKSKSAQTSGSVEGDKPVSDHFLPIWRKQFSDSKLNGYFNEQSWYKAIDIDNKQGNISRHEAAEIIRKLSFKAYESRYKILIMWLPERMNDQASNALLKILEEPWENTIFLLVTEDIHNLLTTIISRTQEVNVPAIETQYISEWLIKNYSLSKPEADHLAKLSFGNLIEAVRLIDEDQGEDENFSLFVQLMRLSFNDKHMELLEWAETVAAMGRENQKNMIENSIRLLREAYMLSMGMGEVSYLHGAEHDFCAKFAPYVNNRNIEALIGEFELALRHITQNGNPKIVFSHFALAASKLIVRI